MKLSTIIKRTSRRFKIITHVSLSMFFVSLLAFYYLHEYKGFTFEELWLRVVEWTFMNGTFIVITGIIVFIVALLWNIFIYLLKKTGW